MEKKLTATSNKVQQGLAESLEATNPFTDENLLEYIHSKVESFDTLKLFEELVTHEIFRKDGFHLPATMPTGQWAHKIDLYKTKDRLFAMLSKTAADLTAAILNADPAHLDAYTLDTAWSYHPHTRYGRTKPCIEWLEEAGYFRLLSDNNFFYFFELLDRKFSYGTPDYEKFMALAESPT